MPEKDPPREQPQEEQAWERFEVLDQEVQRIRAETELPDAASDSELRERLEALDKRLDESKAKRKDRTNRQRQVLGQDPSTARQLGIGLTVAYTVLGVPLAFYAVGWLLDRGTGGEVWRMNLTSLGALLGVIAAIAMLQRAQSQR